MKALIWVNAISQTTFYLFGSFWFLIWVLSRVRLRIEKDDK